MLSRFTQQVLQGVFLLAFATTCQNQRLSFASTTFRFCALKYCFFLNWRLHNPLKTKSKLFHLKTQFVPRSKHFSSRLKETNQFMLYKAKVGVCCNINTIHINTVWAECRIIEC
jgi:hypothetical protein